MSNTKTLRLIRRLPLLAGLPAVLLLSACGGLSGNSIDYQSARTRQALDVPPDLAAPGNSDRYSIAGIGGKTLSEYEKSQRVAGRTTGGAVLVTVPDVTVERDGAQTWLRVALQPDEVWQVVREFWQENGFVIDKESPEIGILDTDWAENRAKVPTDFLRNTLARVFDSLYSSGERDRFRTRLEATPGGTDVFVTHRGLVEVFTDAQEEQTRWQPRPSDPALEAEFLKLLMLRFGDPEVAEAVAAGRGPLGEAAQAKTATDSRVTVVESSDGKRIEIIENFDRAWRNVGLALDRTGFTVEDRDRSQGTYFVRYIDSENPNQEQPGTIARFFGAKPPPAELQSYRIVVAKATAGSQVTVKPPEGVGQFSEESAATAGRMIGLIEQQLRR